MNILFYSSLFVFGTLFGSFSSVIIYRIKSQEGGILNGRSHCSNCNKLLKALDLIPIISYLLNKGRCNKCMNKISKIYPILELSTGFLFTLIGYFLIDSSLIFVGNTLEIYKLIFFLVIGFFTIIYTFYDILFLEIPEIILSLGIGLILIILSIQTVFSGVNIVETTASGIDNLTTGFSAIILSFIIINLLYLVMLKGLKEIWDILIVIIIILSLFIFKYAFNINLTDIVILNGVVGALGIFIFFFIQYLIGIILHKIEKKKKKEEDYRFKDGIIGGGDLRIAILIGLILGVSLSFPGVMITYLVGSIIGIGLILYSKIENIGKNEKSEFNSQIPFGPFLAIGFFVTLFFQNNILELIRIYF